MGTKYKTVGPHDINKQNGLSFIKVSHHGSRQDGRGVKRQEQFKQTQYNTGIELATCSEMAKEF